MVAADIPPGTTLVELSLLQVVAIARRPDNASQSHRARYFQSAIGHYPFGMGWSPPGSLDSWGPLAQSRICIEDGPVVN